MTETTSVKHKTNWLIVALTASVVYVAAMWWIIGNARITIFFDNPRLNEIGDFLAGMFAPIALIWLVAAVLTQRQELNETREQFEASQQVIEKQMENANKQASINAMHYNLAQESAKKAYRLTLFEKRYEVFNELLAFKRKRSDNKYKPEDLNEFREIIKKSAFLFSHGIEEWLRKVADCIDMLIEAEKGVETSIDEFGNVSVQFGTADQLRLRVLRSDIRQHLSDDQLMMRFWKTMHVSDEDENGHPMDMFA